MNTGQTFLVVDGDNMRRAPHLVMGRGPDTHEQIDYGRLLFFAAWEAFGAPKQVEPIFVQHKARGAKRFYAYLERQGYDLRLHRGRSRWAQAYALMEQLHELRATGGDLLFVGGDGYEGGITRMLHEIATSGEGDVMVAHYDGARTIDCGHVRYRGLAADIGAMPELDLAPPEAEPADDLDADARADGLNWKVRRFPTGFEDPGPFGSARWN